MITRFVQMLFLSSFWCLGVFALFYPGMILGNIGDYLEANVNKWLFKPTIGCIPCMGSVHGLIIYMGCFYGQNGPFFLLPFIICLVGINYLAVRMFNINRPE